MRPTLLACLLLAACSSTEAKRVERAVQVDGSGIADATNELGWTVHTTKLRLAFRDVEMTIEGEMHPSTASLLRRAGERLGGFFIGTAHAHPGHYAGGAIDGELLGSFLPDFAIDDGEPLGSATLLTERYNGGNLTFRVASASEGLAAGDPIIGHTAELAGTATKAGSTIQFHAIVDVDDGTRLVGAPLDLDLRDERPAIIGVQLRTVDLFEADTLWKKLDFAALDIDGDGALEMPPGSEGSNTLRRTIQEHDQYALTVR